MTNFIFWIYLNCPTEVCEELREQLNDSKISFKESIAQISSEDLAGEKRDTRISKLKATYFRNQKKMVRMWLTNSIATRNMTPPIELNHITGDVVTAYLLGLKKLNVEAPGYSSYNTHRASVRHLLRLYRFPVSTEFDNILSMDFKSLKRTVANRVNNGGAAVQVGQSPIEFGLYTHIAGQFIRNSNRESVFGNCFFTLCWGLMARVGNVEAICLNHIEWENDSMVVYFAQGKTDQSGENAQYPRHVYANPTCPQICPILNLAMFLLCFPLQSNQVKLFHGSSQYERFRKQLDNTLQNKCQEE